MAKSNSLQPNPIMRYIIAFFILNVLPGALIAQHQHGKSTSTIAPPKIFLDKSPRVVAYQLNRLDNQRLLMVERRTDDKKFIPVYSAILIRVGMSPQYREEAVAALVKLTKFDVVSVLLKAIGHFTPNDRDQHRTTRQLTAMLLRQSSISLRDQTDSLRQALESDNSSLRAAGAAGLIVSGQSDSVISNPNAKLAFLSAVELIPNDEERSILRDAVVRALVNSDLPEDKNAAITALRFIVHQQDKTFELVAPLAAKSSLRDSAIKTLLKIPSGQRSDQTSADLLASLVEHAEKTPAKDRTSDPFIDAMQLADQLMVKVSATESKEYRSRLDAVTVRVVRIKTVEEEMRYDTPYFAVEAGKSVQILLVNEDLMPHNLVITLPESLKEVAQLGLEVGPRGVEGGPPYVPDSDKVLHATDLVPAHHQSRLTFTAPTEPGEYPYVCTFPQHWYRMYGVMVVVEDLDAWQKNPTEPENPIGSNRSFVKDWKMDDLKDVLEAGVKSRSPEIGKRIFVEASCAGCHKVKGEGGVIGPELTDLFRRWKGDRVGLLREILEPSHKIDDKYAMQRVLTSDGQVISGVLIKQDDEAVTLIVSADAKEPTVIAQEEIEQMTPSSVSIMPKALMDQYTKDEIFELMAYLEHAGD